MAVEHARLGLLGESYSSTRLPATWSPKDYPHRGDPGTTTVSLKKIDASTVEETDKRNGKVITLIRLTVSPEGKTLSTTPEDKLAGVTTKGTARSNSRGRLILYRASFVTGLRPMPQKGIGWIQNHVRNKTLRPLNKLVGHGKRVVVLENK